MKKEKRYKTTSVRDKRSIVRTLNTFSKQYEYICCDDRCVDLDLEPVKYYYLDKENDYFKNSIVFSKSNAQIDIRNTDLILDAIDNMISINRKEDLKEDLKEIVESRELENKVNTFLLNKELSISQIKVITNDINFSKRLFSQIENRVIFRRTGIYSSNNYDSTIKSRQILPIPTNLIDSLYEQLDYVIDKLYLFDEELVDLDEIQDKIDEAEEPINKDKRNKSFSQDDIPTEDNTSLYHPIDEQSFNDSGTSNHLTTQQILQNEEGMYNQENYDDYYKLLEEYDEAEEFNNEYEADIEFLLDEIVSFMEYYKVEDKLFEKIANIDEKHYTKYEDFYSKYENFFEELDKYKDKFLHILLKNEYYDYIPEKMIFSIQEKVMIYLKEWAKYPISNIEYFWNNEMHDELLEDLKEEFDLEKDVLEYVVLYEKPENVKKVIIEDNDFEDLF